MATRIEEEVLFWLPVCPHCQFAMKEKRIPLNEVLSPGNQCPRCLSVLDLGDLADAIRCHYDPGLCKICFRPTCVDSHKKDVVNG